jgi:hypothetical protein
MFTVYFNAFWKGFLDKSDPIDYTFFLDFFEKVFKTNCVLGNNIQEADILVESMFGSFQLVGAKQWKYAFYFSGENYAPNDSRYTAIFCGTTKYPNCFVLPQILVYMHCQSLVPKFINRPLRPHIPSKFACSVISNPNGSVRNKFIQRMEDRGIHVDHGGQYKNNIGCVVSGHYNSPSMESFFKEYKFAITMENSFDEYYITEKICHGLQAGVIPIYWGTQRVTEYINKERILLLENESETAMDSLIDKMLSMSESEYLEIVNKHILVNPNILNNIVLELQTLIDRKDG